MTLKDLIIGVIVFFSFAISKQFYIISLCLAMVYYIFTLKIGNIKLWKVLLQKI